MANTVSKSDIADILSNAAWAIRSTYHTVLKSSPGAAIFDGRNKLLDGNTDKSKQITTQDRKMPPTKTETTNPVTKYCCKKTVSSAKQKAGMKVILGPSRQFIRMAP
eukprot:CCRYP_016899-RA/>CCRYP_016899-RA protein AED:0.43 eAED:0.76 QI:0/0/0/1/0/0/2/0/106